MRRQRSSGTVPDRARWRRPGGLTVLVALAGLGFGLAATAPLWLDPGGSMIGPNVADAHHYLWWLGHTPHAIGQGENPLRTLDLNWPEGVSTMNNTTLLLPSLLLWPVTALAGSLAGLNVLNILAVPACVAGGYWALRRVPGGRPGGLGPAAPLGRGGGVRVPPAGVRPPGRGRTLARGAR